MLRRTHSTVQGRLIGTFAGVAVTVAIILGFTFFELSALARLQDEGADLAAAAHVAQRTAAMGAEVYQVVADTQINLAFDDAAREWSVVVADAREDFAQLDAVVDTDRERADARRMREAFDAIVALYERDMVPALKAAGAATDGTRAADGKIDELAGVMQTAGAALTESITAESKAGDERFDATATQTRVVLLALTLSGCVFMAVTGWLLLRWLNGALGSMAHELRAGADQVLAASGQVASSSQALSQGATEQAASLEETSASMEEMASMTRRNADSAAEAARLMTGVDEKVQASHADLEATVAAMDAISESSGKISKIIKTIDEIAFQTNILALNAAVEAARAGDAGMGFAVVANEVRNLAQRAAAASRDTAGLIEEARANASLGTDRVVKLRGAIQGFAGDVRRVRGIAEEVSAASRQQTQGFDQVTQAVTQMEKVTQTTAATAEEGAAASEELNAQAEQSVAVVQQLEALIGRDSQVVSAAPTAPGRVEPVSARRRAA